MPRVQLSFKNNNEELELYNEVNKSYDKSAFIKECIRFYLDNKYIKTTKEEDPQVTNDIDDIDWEF